MRYVVFKQNCKCKWMFLIRKQTGANLSPVSKYTLSMVELLIIRRLHSGLCHA